MQHGLFPEDNKLNLKCHMSYSIIFTEITCYPEKFTSKGAWLRLDQGKGFSSQAKELRDVGNS